MSSRHRSREVALQVLVALDFRTRRGEGQSVSPAELMRDVAGNFEVPAGAEAFAMEIVAAVAAKRDALDSVIAAHSQNWRVERMGVVDRNVLRMATYELESTDTPVPVVLDEAVEMARRFGSETSPAFVNGILDAVARSQRGR